MTRPTKFLHVVFSVLLLALPALATEPPATGPQPNRCSDTRVLQASYLYFEWGTALFIRTPLKCESDTVGHGGKRILIVSPYPGKHPKAASMPKRILAYVANRQEHAIDRIYLLNRDGWLPEEVTELLREAARTDLPAPKFWVGEIVAPFELPEALQSTAARIEAVNRRPLWHVKAPGGPLDLDEKLDEQWIAGPVGPLGLTLEMGVVSIDTLLACDAKTTTPDWTAERRMRMLQLPATAACLKAAPALAAAGYRAVVLGPGPKTEEKTTAALIQALQAGKTKPYLAGPGDRDCKKIRDHLECTHGAIVPGRMLSTDGANAWVDSTPVFSYAPSKPTEYQ